MEPCSYTTFNQSWTVPFERYGLDRYAKSPPSGLLEDLKGPKAVAAREGREVVTKTWRGFRQTIDKHTRKVLRGLDTRVVGWRGWRHRWVDAEPEVDKGDEARD